jgi:hypothetical protein
MKKFTLFIYLLLCSYVLSAQKIANVDFDAVKKSSDSSSGAYKKLLDRFVKADTTLTKKDYTTLYYGQCFQKEYDPYGTDDNFDKFKKFYQGEDFTKALPYALKMIEKNPMDMKMTFKALVCYYKMNDEAGKFKMGLRYNNIMSAIFDSGDGKTAATAFVVMCVSDEYELMASMKVENSAQSLDGNCDVMDLKKNDLNIDKLYFNVSKPLEALSNMFKNK